MNWRMRRRLRKRMADWDAYWHIRFYADLPKLRRKSPPVTLRPARMSLEWPRDPALVRELRESFQKACSK